MNTLFIHDSKISKAGGVVYLSSYLKFNYDIWLII